MGDAPHFIGVRGEKLYLVDPRAPAMIAIFVSNFVNFRIWQSEIAHLFKKRAFILAN
ncbi:hypothetical protein ES703_111033 [subsurface metagenome]